MQSTHDDAKTSGETVCTLPGLTGTHAAIKRYFFTTLTLLQYPGSNVHIAAQNLSNDGNSSGRAGALPTSMGQNVTGNMPQAGPSSQVEKIYAFGESMIPEINEGFINSDDEFDALLDAIKANGPEPLAVPRIATPHPYHWSFRMRDVILHAMSWRNRPLQPNSLPTSASTSALPMEQAMRQAMLLQPNHANAGTTGKTTFTIFIRSLR